MILKAFLCIDVVLKEPWMQFHKGFNGFLVVLCNEIRNMEINILKYEQKKEENEVCCSNDEK